MILAKKSLDFVQRHDFTLFGSKKISKNLSKQQYLKINHSCDPMHKDYAENALKNACSFFAEFCGNRITENTLCINLSSLHERSI